MNTIPRHLILDLLPLYLAEEVSEETRTVIEAYLQTDPQLAQLAQRAKNVRLVDDIPLPQAKENEMEALKKIKRLMVQHNLFLVMATACTFMFGMSVIFLADESPIAWLVLLLLAGFFWLAFFTVNRQLDH